MLGHLAQSMVASVNYLESAFEHLLIAVRSQSGRSVGARNRAYLQDGPRSLQSVGQRMDAEIRHVKSHVIEISVIYSFGRSERTISSNFFFEAVGKRWLPTKKDKKGGLSVGYVNISIYTICMRDKENFAFRETFSFFFLCLCRSFCHTLLLCIRWRLIFCFLVGPFVM